MMLVKVLVKYELEWKIVKRVEEEEVALNMALPPPLFTFFKHSRS